MDYIRLNIKTMKNILWIAFGVIFVLIGVFNQLWALYAIGFAAFVYGAFHLVRDVQKDME